MWHPKYQPVHQGIIDRGDRVFHDLSMELLMDAVAWADGMMKQLSATRINQAFDCPNESKLKAELVTLYCAKRLGAGKGVPAGTYGYYRDSDGREHEVCQAYVGTKHYVFEGMLGYTAIRQLSDTERARCTFDFIG